MRRSHFFIKTKRDVAAQDSKNAYLLDKAGYISQVSSGVYALMPLGLRVVQKIEQVVREEMNALGASEVSFSALQPKEVWEQSGRFEDENFKQILYFDEQSQMTFAPTHEEPMTKAILGAVQSYKELPVLLYQFQTKFRRELRAKSGLLRGREFRMKDLYSFHSDANEHNKFYESAAKAYLKVFERLGLEVYRTKASGGIFTKQFSDEFQVLCDTGEDELLVNHQTQTGYNTELEGELSETEKRGLEKVRGIEVGNIFHLESKYSDAYKLKYQTKEGEQKSVIMGSYGIGITRLLGTIAEISNDEDGLIMPAVVAPFKIYLIDLTKDNQGEAIYKQLIDAKAEVLFDDRDVSTGEKMFDADLIGLPIRVVVSQKSLEQGGVELKNRAQKATKVIPVSELLKLV
ncbi:prolyl-tRNA synthetase [Candidatus Berkelbacteria bacterium]|nr:prolyl-tRNA synthetase [Candidatus Berkelbacteria bacterium]